MTILNHFDPVAAAQRPRSSHASFLIRTVQATPVPFVHAYFHPDPNDCRDYAQCHARAYGPGGGR